MDHRQMFICNNYRFWEDWGKVGPIENYVKNIFKKIENSQKTLRKIWTIIKFLFAMIANVFRFAIWMNSDT